MWYDLFSLFYDRALEDLYAPYRASAVDALHLAAGQTVLDLPCGTGQSLELLVSAVGEEGVVVAVDRSRGMLRRASQRVARSGWQNVSLVRADVNRTNEVQAADSLVKRSFDAVHCALGLTAIPNWEQGFETMYALLRPGGRFVLFDVYAPKRTKEARSVELVARADLSREVWRSLESRSTDFDRQLLPADPKLFGGELYVASGTKTV